MSSETLHLLAPEIVLVLVGTALYIAGAFIQPRAGWSVAAAAGLLLAGIALYWQQAALIGQWGSLESSQSLHGPIAVDLFAQMLRWFILGTGLVFVLICSRASAGSLQAEFMGSLLLIVAGLMVIAIAGDLVLMFLGLELVSIPTYVLLYLGRNDAASQESTTKYFFLSILSSALLLYGFSFLYGIAGSTGFVDIHSKLASGAGSGSTAILAKLAVLLIAAGLGFRITIVPFHFYAPDVYEGTIHANAGLLAVVPKIAGLTALVRIVAQAMVGMESLAWILAITLAILTMTLGNLLALWQQNIRRMMAYSSIAHAGYMLIGLAVAFAVAADKGGGNEINGIGATMFYLVVYAIATAGTFAALASLSDSRHQVDRIDELAGLARTRPRTAAAIALFMFSLTGLPPVAGFFGKFYLFLGALGVDSMDQGMASAWRPFLLLAFIGILNAAVSAAYYLRIVGAMYFRPPTTTALPNPAPAASLATLVCAVLVALVGLVPDPVFQRASRAVESGRATFAAAGDRSRPVRTLRTTASASIRTSHSIGGGAK